MHFYTWKNGLKTGMYYLRSRPAADAIKFTLNVEELLKATDGNDTDSIIKCLNATKEIETKVDAKTEKKETSANGVKSVKNYEEQEGCISCSG